MLRRHTGLRISPGYVVYGLDTYHRLWCNKIDQVLAPILKPVSETLKSAVRLGAGLIISHTITKSQGLYADGWAGRSLNYMLPTGSGDLLVEGFLPQYNGLQKQKLYVTANGLSLGGWDVADGDFLLKVPVPAGITGQPLRLRIEASRWVAERHVHLPGPRRRLAYRLRSIRWAHAPAESVPIAVPASSRLTECDSRATR
jgi:hypothetical protein